MKRLVLALALVVSPAIARSAASLGVNLTFPFNWNSGAYIWANVAKNAMWYGVGSWGANGYPVGGASLHPFEGSYLPSYFSGSGYSLRFKAGAGCVTTGVNGLNLGSGSYDAGSGVWTYPNVSLTVNSSNPGISFSTSVSDVWFGLPGATYGTHYWNPDFLTALAPFTVIRTMQAQQTNTESRTSPITTWSQRIFPGSVGYATRQGGANEEWILLANLASKDIWINVHPRVDVAYFTKLAQQLLYGTDGATGEPLDAGTTHDPATWTPSTTAWYPGLATGRNVYIEFGNEWWNTAGPYGPDRTYAINQYDAELAGGDPHHFAGGGSDGGYHKWVAWKTLQISQAFRNVWGDSAMGTRIRIVYGTQGDYGTAGAGNGWYYGRRALQYVDAVFSTGLYGATIDGVPTGHPVNWYIHDVSGSLYLHWASPATVDQAFTQLNQSLSTTGGTTGEGNCIQERIDWGSQLAMDYGLKLTTYETGTEIRPGNWGTNIAAQADADARMHTLHYDLWSRFAAKSNADAFMYFWITGPNSTPPDDPGSSLDTGLGPDLRTLGSERWGAMNQIAAEGGGPTLVSIAVTPASAARYVGQTQQFTCTATWSSGPDSDCTTTADWTSSQTGVATIGLHTGLATAVAAGSTTIQASYSGQTDTSPMTVTAAPTVVSVAVTPNPVGLTVGGTQQFVCTATWSDTSQTTCTSASGVAWSSDNEPAATVTAGAGFATAWAAGTAHIQAAYGGQNGNSTLTVSAAGTTSIETGPEPWDGITIE